MHFSIACSVKEILWKQTLEIIKAQLNKLTIDLISEEELEKSKNLILGGIARGIDDPHELPRLIADTELMFSNEKELSVYLERIRSLTSNDIMNVAKKYFREKNYSTAILGPK